MFTENRTQIVPYLPFLLLLAMVTMLFG
ncbi:hypothetical protein [Pseudomonas sp. DP16D-R1]